MLTTVRAFLGTELSVCEPQRGPAEEDMRSAPFTRAQVGQMVCDGQMVDAKSFGALMLLNLLAPP